VPFAEARPCCYFPSRPANFTKEACHSSGAPPSPRPTLQLGHSGEWGRRRALCEVPFLLATNVCKTAHRFFGPPTSPSQDYVAVRYSSCCSRGLPFAAQFPGLRRLVEHLCLSFPTPDRLFDYLRARPFCSTYPFLIRQSAGHGQLSRPLDRKYYRRPGFVLRLAILKEPLTRSINSNLTASVVFHKQRVLDGIIKPPQRPPLFGRAIVY